MNNLISLLKDSKIVIPPIQRDYAQGRNNGKIPSIRSRFIEDIYKALTEDTVAPLELDFIYGYNEIDTKNNEQIKVFKPLDGQQRLTTLFLIHWFVARKEYEIDEAKPLLSKFSYATRESSRRFCDKLINFEVDWESDKKVDDQIKNQPWFYSNWKNDPTIQSMLVVLRAIHEKFDNVNDVWEKLTGKNPKIIFHLLSMNNLGLPDDLYIKMNARGKALTDFEHFKSSFSEILNAEQAKHFKDRIDGEWSDLLWNIFRNNEGEDIAKLVDAGFLSFFWYITDILINQNNIIFSDNFWLNKVKFVYKDKPENSKFLFDCLDLFLTISKSSKCPFNNIFYVIDEDFVLAKTKLFFQNANPNLFHKCVKTYQQGNFVIREQLLFYAFIQINLNKIDVPVNFYRLTRNLLENASDKEVRYDNIKNLYLAIDALIKGERNPDKLPFTKRQLMEEAAKLNFINSNPDLKEIIYKLEDHTSLRGSIGVFDLDSTIKDLGEFFLRIFYPGQNYFEVSRAMLTIGFYPQKYGKNYLRFGNKNNSSWREVLTESENRTGFTNTKVVLRDYLKFCSLGIDNNTIISNYFSADTLAKDLSYYYIKYNSFILWSTNDGKNHQTEGFYWWQNLNTHPYECIMLFRTNFIGRSWSPFLLELSAKVEECSIENYNSKLQFTKGNLILLIEHFNKGFKFSAPSGEHISLSFLDKLIMENKLNDEGILIIEQDINGIDQIDRIETCIDFLNSLTLK
jgi:hypothetical protein